MWKVAGIALGLSMFAAEARADIVLFMNDWDTLQIQVKVGNNQDCNQNVLIYDQVIQKGWRSPPVTGVGSSQADLCWRRTADPLAGPTSPLQTVWTRCSADGECEID